MEERTREPFDANQQLQSTLANLEKLVGERTDELRIAREQAEGAAKAKSSFQYEPRDPHANERRLACSACSWTPPTKSRTLCPSMHDWAKL